MEQWIVHLIEQYGYIGITVLILIENLFPPIPSELILLFSGFMAGSSGLSPFGMVAGATFGSVSGAILLYGVGKRFDEHYLSAWVERHGYRLRLRVEDIKRADAWFDRFGPKFVLFGRCVPVVRSLISIPAGMSNMPFRTFVVLTTVGTAVWNTVLITIGVQVGENWREWLSKMEVYTSIVYIILIGVVVVAGIYAGIVWKKRKGVKDQ